MVPEMARGATWAAAAAAGLLGCLPAGAALMAWAGPSSASSAGAAGAAGGLAPAIGSEDGAGGADSVPPAMLSLYVAADAGACPGMPWQVLAAIGFVESDHGASTAPGVQSGANQAGAEGVMQFEPATFAEYSSPVPPGGAAPPDPYDATDAVWAAARMLCANGAGAGPQRLVDAIYAYNHSGSYVTRVWQVAVSYGMDPDGTADNSGGDGSGT